MPPAPRHRCLLIRGISARRFRRQRVRSKWMGSTFRAERIENPRRVFLDSKARGPAGTPRRTPVQRRHRSRDAPGAIRRRRPIVSTGAGTATALSRFTSYDGERLGHRTTKHTERSLHRGTDKSSRNEHRRTRVQTPPTNTVPSRHRRVQINPGRGEPRSPRQSRHGQYRARRRATADGAAVTEGGAPIARHSLSKAVRRGRGKNGGAPPELRQTRRHRGGGSAIPVARFFGEFDGKFSLARQLGLGYRARDRPARATIRARNRMASAKQSSRWMWRCASAASCRRSQASTSS